MKRFMLVLLSLALLAALLPAALAEVGDDDFGYVEKFTLEDGTELPVEVEYKDEWEYSTWDGPQTAEHIPMYTVTVPENGGMIYLYLTETGDENFHNNQYVYNYVYDIEADTCDPNATAIMASSFEYDEDHFTVPVVTAYGYVWHDQNHLAGAILVFKVGELPTPDPAVTGDVNGDGMVTVDDAILVLRHVAGLDALTGDSLTLADANGDKAVDVNDAIVILKSIANSTNTGAGSVLTLTIE